MKKAVAYLQPFMESEKAASAGGDPGQSPARTVKATCTTSAKTSSASCSLQQLRSHRPWRDASCEKILAAAATSRWTSSPERTDYALVGQMAHVAREMEREGLKLPLLIGAPRPARPTRRENRARLPSTGRSCSGCQPRRAGGRQPHQRGVESRLRPSNPSGIRPLRSSTRPATEAAKPRSRPRERAEIELR